MLYEELIRLPSATISTQVGAGGIAAGQGYLDVSDSSAGAAVKESRSYRQLRLKPDGGIFPDPGGARRNSWDDRLKTLI
ncbi:hypothetical protein ATY76_00985 [Rhizobium sp. R339]|nr:hypothetical protein ATY76_00985 [Rhizobium sp. R339]